VKFQWVLREGSDNQGVGGKGPMTVTNTCNKIMIRGVGKKKKKRGGGEKKGKKNKKKEKGVGGCVLVGFWGSCFVFCGNQKKTPPKKRGSRGGPTTIFLCLFLVF